MDEEKFKKLFTDSIPTISTVPGLENYLTMSRELLEDYKRQARAEEREHIIAYLNSLVNTSTNLYGAVKLLEGKYDKN
jgi:hypothetical protein